MSVNFDSHLIYGTEIEICERCSYKNMKSIFEYAPGSLLWHNFGDHMDGKTKDIAYFGGFGKRFYDTGDGDFGVFDILELEVPHPDEVQIARDFLRGNGIPFTKSFRWYWAGNVN